MHGAPGYLRLLCSQLRYRWLLSGYGTHKGDRPSKLLNAHRCYVVALLCPHPPRQRPTALSTLYAFYFSEPACTPLTPVQLLCLNPSSHILDFTASIAPKCTVDEVRDTSQRTIEIYYSSACSLPELFTLLALMQRHTYANAVYRRRKQLHCESRTYLANT